jgi:ABC-type transport system involved in cytochrome c biogenesis permease subunit
MVTWDPWDEGAGPMTRSLRRIDWAALGAKVGSAVLFTLLLLGPFLVGAPYGLWLVGLAIGIILGIYFYLRRERYSEPGLDADGTRFPP